MNIRRVGRKRQRPEYVNNGGGVFSAWTELLKWTSVYISRLLEAFFYI